MPRALVGTVQHYDWGDDGFIPDLLGIPRDGRPWAELWFGTHPLAPSRVDSADGPLLSDVAGELPFLVKVLACAEPLSLQTHPDSATARAGFAREEAAGMARDAATRMYRDPFDKPEQLVAMTPFEALCGFTGRDEAVARLRSWGWDAEADVLADRGTRAYMEWAFTVDSLPPLGGCPEWVGRVAARHPGDRALRVAALLHHVVLRPGESIALPAGNLHAYLRGAGLEVMRSSDNVVRAGFTTKHVDVDELLSVVDESPLADPVVHPVRTGSLTTWDSPSPAFSVSALDWTRGDEIAPSPTWRVAFGIHGCVVGVDEPGAILIAPGERVVLGSVGGSPPTGTIRLVDGN